MDSNDSSAGVKPRRAYRSARRQALAEATRRRILGAARRLFVERGYGGTGVEALAEAAGVAVPTLYTTFGGKRGILDALFADMERDVGVVERFDRVAAEPDPVLRLRHVARIHRDFVERYWDVLEALRTAAASAPDVAAAWRAADAHRLRDARVVARSLARDGALRPGLTEEEAADVVWLLTSPDTYRHLAVERGWPLDRYEAWLGDALIQLLLPQ